MNDVPETESHDMPKPLRLVQVGVDDTVELTIRDFSRTTGLPEYWIRERIREGRIRELRDGVIPGSELVTVMGWADYLGAEVPAWRLIEHERE